MKSDDLVSRNDHRHADPARAESAKPSHRLEVTSNQTMIAFMIASAVLLAMVSLWVFAQFSPQTLRLGVGAEQTIAAASSPAATAQPMPSPALTPAPLPISVPSSVPPNFSTGSAPSPGGTAAPATPMIDMPLPATNPTSTAMAGPQVTTATPAVPTAPTNVTATAGDAAAAISWTAPTDGGSTITSYTVTPYLGTSAQAPTVITGSPPATNATVSGLQNGATYTFTVAARNSVGTGPESAASNAVTTFSATVPGAPSDVTGTADVRSVTLTWTAPSDGGSTITSYTITPYIGASAQTPTVITGGPPATNATITGLQNGTTYTFVITATNAIGTGPPSAESNAVTPPH